MKKKYESPLVEIIYFEKRDVITGSEIEPFFKKLLKKCKSLFQSSI